MVASWVSQASFEPLGLTISVAKDRAIESMMQVREAAVIQSDTFGRAAHPPLRGVDVQQAQAHDTCEGVPRYALTLSSGQRWTGRWGVACRLCGGEPRVCLWLFGQTVLRTLNQLRTCFNMPALLLLLWLLLLLRARW
jgi:hypothetical protein